MQVHLGRRDSEVPLGERAIVDGVHFGMRAGEWVARNVVRHFCRKGRGTDKRGLKSTTKQKKKLGEPKKRNDKGSRKKVEQNLESKDTIKIRYININGLGYRKLIEIENLILNDEHTNIFILIETHWRHNRIEISKKLNKLEKEET